MLHHSKILLLALCLTFISACDNGGTSSGGGNAVTPAPTPAPTPTPAPPTTQAGEGAIACLAQVQARTNRTALVQNVCGYPINVRQTNSRFDTPAPVTEIAPGQLVAVPLGDDSLSIELGACRSPSTPEPSSPGFFVCSQITVSSKSTGVIDQQQFNVLRLSR